MSDKLKAAAQRVAESIELAASGVSEGDALERTYNGDIDGFTRDMKRLADSTLASLDAKEAERAERAKPIDAEWLKAIGSRCPKSKRWFILFERTYGPSRYETQLRAKMQPDGCYVIVTQGYGDDADDDDKEDVVSFACEFTTRGQLLDLLNALKGGA